MRSPLVLAALAGALHGVLQAVGVVHRLVERQALDAQLAVRARVQRVAFHALHLAVLDVEQDAARRVAPRRRIVVGAGDGVAVFLPLPLPLVVRLAIYAVKEFLVVSHGVSPILLVLTSLFPAAGETCGRAPSGPSRRSRPAGPPPSGVPSPAGRVRRMRPAWSPSGATAAPPPPDAAIALPLRACPPRRFARRKAWYPRGPPAPLRGRAAFPAPKAETRPRRASLLA